MNLPFQNELMTCTLCGKQLQNVPQVESGWRMTQVEGERYYFCTDHFPPDGKGSKEEWRQAWLAAFRGVLKVHNQKHPE